MKNKVTRRIRGSGGDDSSSSQHIPVDDPNSLHSAAFLRIVDLIAEGEIVGLVDGSKSIFFNETPLENPDGSLNFAGVTYEGRTGTQDQSYLAGFTTVESETQVNVEVKAGTGDPTEVGFAVVRQITDPNVNRVRLSILIPQLTQSNTNGDIHGTSVTMSVWVQPSGGSYAKQLTRVISGKSSSRYEVSVSVDLTGSAPWNVKLVRETPDSTDQYLSNKTYFDTYTEVIDAKLRYPNSALIGLRIGAEQFSNVPTRAYDVKLLKVKVPSNYDPDTRTYTGSWDGTFQTLWSDNPAWVFYDLVTSERYGLGSFVPEDQVDKWALYEIAKYCDEYVPDGFGGTEPRFTCNLILTDRTEAYTILQNLASVFRGMIYWSAGSVTVTQDAPVDPAYLFTPANVVEGRFGYQGASATARHSVALVSWNDPADFCRLKVEYVEDQDAIIRFGVQETQVTAFGCTSRGQAHRLGKWLLYTEQNESEIVTFQTGIEGIVGRPGQVIQIADPSRAGARMGGRILAATTSAITIDQAITESLSGNILAVLLPNGTVEESTIVGQIGTVITVQPAFSVAPLPQSIWIAKTTDVEPQTFRVVSIKEDGGGLFTITALRHDPDKFAAIEQDILLEPKSYTNLRALTDSPSNVKITESLYQSASEVKAKMTVSWDRVDRAVSYVIRYKKDDDNFIELPEAVFTDQEILDVQPGFYTIQVSAINAVGKRSTPTQISKEVYGKSLPPADVTGFSMIPNVGQAYLSWDQAVDLDVLVGGQVRIRHTPRTTAQAWKDAIDVIPAVAGTATSALAPLLSGTYMAKFVDSSGNLSVDEVMIVTTVPYALALNVVDTITESPAYLGVKNDMTIDTFNGALVLASGEFVDDYGLVDSLGSWDFPGGIVNSGTYDFQNTVDLGGVWPSRISSVIDLEAFDIGNVIDQRVNFIDSWQDIDGSLIDDVNAALYLRTTEDDPGLSPTWTDWKRISTGEYSARGLQFQLRCTSGSGDHNLYIKQLQVTIDMEDRSVNMGPLTSGTGSSYRVAYSEAFFANPAISITANDMMSGDYYSITSADETGFNIVFMNSSGTVVSRVFSVIAKGYGRKVA